MSKNKKAFLATLTRKYLICRHHVEYNYNDIYNLIDYVIPMNGDFIEFAMAVKKYFETVAKAA